MLPILVWQVWGFFAPAVDRATQRALSVFIVAATGLFATGVVFAYFVVLPAAITFLTNFDDTLYNVQIRASYYLSFTSLVLIACGLAFEMPIFILALVRIRVLTYDKLRRNRKIGYALMVAFAILLPDRRPRLAPLRSDPAARPLRSIDLALPDHGTPSQARGPIEWTMIEARKSCRSSRIELSSEWDFHPRARRRCDRSEQAQPNTPCRRSWDSTGTAPLRKCRTLRTNRSSAHQAVFAQSSLF